MSSLSDTERVQRWIKQLHQLQRNPWWVWGSLVGGLLIATLIRWAIGGLVQERIPFTTYYPAIVVATLLGGFWNACKHPVGRGGMVAVHVANLRLRARSGTICLTDYLRSRLPPVSGYGHCT
jgi:hypothetical protein